MKSDTNCSWYLTKCLDSRQEDNNKATTKRRPYDAACSCAKPKNTRLIRQKVSSYHVSLSVMSRVLFLVLWGESTVWTVNDVLSRSIPFYWVDLSIPLDLSRSISFYWGYESTQYVIDGPHCMYAILFLFRFSRTYVYVDRFCVFLHVTVANFRTANLEGYVNGL